MTAAGVAGALALLALAPGVVASAYVAFVVFGWSFVAATSALIAWAGHVLPSRAAWGTSVLFVLLVVGQALGSTVAGASAVRGRRGVFAGAAVVAVVAALCGAPVASAVVRVPRPLATVPPSAAEGSSDDPSTGTARSRRPRRTSDPGRGPQQQRDREGAPSTGVLRAWAAGGQRPDEQVQQRERAQRGRCAHVLGPRSRA